jgi:hypothetical protein
MPVESAKLMPSGRTVKFGRKPATAEQRRKIVPLAPFVKKYGGKPPPARVDYHTKAARSLRDMLGNDQYGNCVVAAELHGIGAWSANEPGGAEIVPTTKEAVAQYQSICGPGDNGCYIPAVLDHFRDRGLTAGGKARKMEGYVSVNPRDQLLVQYAMWLSGGLHLGVNWPGDWMSLQPGFILKPTNSRMVGGHAVMAVGYDDTGLQISTWGIVGTLSWEALADRRFVDECYARLGEDWHNDEGATAAGVNVDALREALKTVAAGGYPDIPNEPEPGPGPGPNPPAPVAWDWEFERSVELLGYQLRVHLGVDLRRALAGARTLNWWTIAADVARIVAAFGRRDWAGLAIAVQQLLTDLGIAFNPTGFEEFSRAMVGSHETRPLDSSSPPAPPPIRRGPDTDLDGDSGG